jgi:pimeloyl-ACP methyl ester carboxylesterase
MRNGSGPAGPGNVRSSILPIASLHATMRVSSTTFLRASGGAKRQHYAAIYALPGAMRSGFAQFAAFGQDAIDSKAFLARGKLTMPVLAVGGEAAFGSMMATVMRCVAVNVKEAIISDCGHWIMDEQPAATTKLVTELLNAHK